MSDSLSIGKFILKALENMNVKQVTILLSLVTAVLLFSPDVFIDKLGLMAFKKSYHSWIGLTFLFSTGFAIPNLVKPFLLTGTPAGRKIKSYLRNLTPKECEILKQYIQKNTRTQYLDLTDGIVAGLEHNKILYQARNISAGDTTFAYNMQPVAWNYLKKNPDVLEC